MKAFVWRLLLLLCCGAAAAHTAQAAAAAPPAAAAADAATCKQPAAAVAGSAVLDPDTGKLQFQPGGGHPDALAHGVYVDSAHTASNFGKLRVVTSAAATDEQQMRAAGWLEGYLTAARINDHHHNLKSYFLNQLEAKLEQPMQWIAQQEKWLSEQVAAHPDDAFWRSVGLLRLQLDGMYEGYAAAIAAARTAGQSAELLSRTDLLFLNSNGELYDLMDMFDADEQQARLERMAPDELLMHLSLQGHCSALIKVAPDLSDIFFGHSTWDSFTAMTRIYKHLELHLAQVPGGVAAQHLSFSSYPGELFSDDDFYITSAGLVVLETTNHIYDFDVLKGLSPATVPSWLRVRAANLLAADGQTWVDIFRRHNSGTYNNMYMVTDLKRFKPGSRLMDGLLWVVEQLPGMVEAEDVTQQLARGYWPSYNVAYSPRIYEAAGYPKLQAQAAAKGRPYDAPRRWLMYQVSPRANIFRRDQGSVGSLEGIKALMRYNGALAGDELSGGHPVASVCSRGDLAPMGALPKGCYDTKVTSASLALRLEAEAVGGPTHSQGLPPFEWGDKYAGFEHRGMPDRYDAFVFERHTPAELRIPNLECQPEQPPAAAAGEAQLQQDDDNVAGGLQLPGDWSSSSVQQL